MKNRGGGGRQRGLKRGGRCRRSERGEGRGGEGCFVGVGEFINIWGWKKSMKFF